MNEVPRKPDRTSNAGPPAIPTACEWEGFLKRAPLAHDPAQAAASLRGKRILVTGAGGWIGSALTRAIAELAPRQLVLLEAAERNLYEIDSALRQQPFPIEHVSVLGSVSQSALLAEIFRRYRPQVVYHAAAFKHVPLMEQNPFAAIENNTLATHRLVEVSVHHETEQLILLSTDKAVDPVSIMGASKRIAELILLATPAAATRMKAVRLGNVLGSEGSIVPLFLKQIQAGQPVTITHPEVRRYFLTTADAVSLLLHASSAGTAPGIQVPELAQPVPVVELARHLMTNQSSPAARQVPIVFTELRPGDKMCEALLSSRESYAADGAPAAPLRAIKSPNLAAPVLDEILQQLQQACQERSLERLLTAVLRAVPEYQPSILLRETA
jgi:FlaA1/EpsC-like NDP-sugar epimerase